MNTKLIDAEKIVNLQKKFTELWHQETPSVTADDFYAFVEHNHMQNFLLWHEEDKARRDDMGFEYVYHAKRNIDQHNQLRNNYMEAMDEWIIYHYHPKQNGCPCHSETPGMIIDRLSILALKEFHMHEQVNRNDISIDHRNNCETKWKAIIIQLQQLKDNLKNLLSEIRAGTRTFRVYHQFKMYNDPNLNPQLYQNKNHVT